MDEQGEVVDPRSRIQRSRDVAAQDLVVDRDLHLLAALRLAHLDRDGLFGEALQEGVEFVSEVREGFVTTRLSGTGGEDLLQPLL